MLIRTGLAVPPSPRHSSTYGPAGMVRPNGRVPLTGPNRHVPAAPAGGRAITGPLVRQSHPAGSIRLSVMVAVRSAWSKQQKRPGGPVQLPPVEHRVDRGRRQLGERGRPRLPAAEPDLGPRPDGFGGQVGEDV